MRHIIIYRKQIIILCYIGYLSIFVYCVLTQNYTLIGIML